MTGRMTGRNPWGRLEAQAPAFMAVIAGRPGNTA
jgi:hypothetical protein